MGLILDHRQVAGAGNRIDAVFELGQAVLSGVLPSQKHEIIDVESYGNRYTALD